jgi:hypothetical protein
MENHVQSFLILLDCVGPSIDSKEATLYRFCWSCKSFASLLSIVNKVVIILIPPQSVIGCFKLFSPKTLVSNCRYFTLDYLITLCIKSSYQQANLDLYCMIFDNISKIIEISSKASMFAVSIRLPFLQAFISFLHDLGILSNF